MVDILGPRTLVPTQCLVLDCPGAAEHMWTQVDSSHHGIENWPLCGEHYVGIVSGEPWKPVHDARSPRRWLLMDNDASTAKSMPQPWTLDHLTRRHWSITNRSGFTARSVTFIACGPLLISGRKDWATNIDHLDDGHGYAVTGTAGWGGTHAKPEIRVTWYSNDRPDKVKVATLGWPGLPIHSPNLPVEVVQRPGGPWRPPTGASPSTSSRSAGV